MFHINVYIKNNSNSITIENRKAPINCFKGKREITQLTF